MMWFWIVAGCLIGAALLFVVPPLLRGRAVEAGAVGRRAINVSIYRNQLDELEADFRNGDIGEEQYRKSRDELEKRLLEDVAAPDDVVAATAPRRSAATAGVVAVVVPVLAVAMYLAVGNPAALDPKAATMAATSPHGDGNADPAQMQQQIAMMVGKLEEKLQQDPSNIEGWVMLGRSYSVLNRYPEAVQAYEKVLSVAGNDPQVLADYADALAMANGESLEGKPVEMLQKALSIDPRNQKALWLIGTAAFERGDFAQAIDYWQRLKSQLPPGSEDAQMMEANIGEARQYLARQGGALPPEPAAAPQQAATAARISGRVSLSPALKGKVQPGDTLFVFARAVSGPPMPLAIIRSQAKDLPLEFTLDESMAMMPGMSLANFSEVTVGARVSRSGNAMPQSGDLQGLAGTVKVGSSGLNITIDQVVP